MLNKINNNVPSMNDINNNYASGNDNKARAEILNQMASLLASVGVSNVDALKSFMDEVASVSSSDDSVLIYALIYLCRVKANNPSLRVARDDAGNCLFITALLLAWKVAYDKPYYNRSWAEIANYVGLPFSLDQVNAMEREMLALLKFELHVSDADYAAYYALCSAVSDLLAAVAVSAPSLLKKSGSDDVDMVDSDACSVFMRKGRGGGFDDRRSFGDDDNNFGPSVGA